MVEISDAVREVLTAGRLAHLTTINADGSPQMSAVWVGVEDGEIVLGHLGAGRKLRNIQREPRVALNVEAEGTSPIGLPNYLTIQGTARLTEGGAPELLQRLAVVYLGPGVKFPPFDDPPPGHVVHIRVDRVGGAGPWAT